MHANCVYVVFTYKQNCLLCVFWIVTIRQICKNLPNGNSVTNGRRIAIRKITLKLKRKRNLRYFKFTFTLPYSVECLCPNAHIDGCDKFSFFVGRSSFKNPSKPIFVCEVQVKMFVMEEEGHTVEGDQSLSDKLNQLQQIGMMFLVMP